MYITAQGPRLRNDLYCVEWDSNIPYHLDNHLAGTDNLTRTTKREHKNIHIHIQTQTNGTQKVTLINSKEHSENCDKRRQSEPGLVAFRHIQPGNGAGLFFQPRSPHSAGHFCSEVLTLQYAIFG